MVIPTSGPDLPMRYIASYSAIYIYSGNNRVCAEMR